MRDCDAAEKRNSFGHDGFFGSGIAIVFHVGARRSLMSGRRRACGRDDM